MHNLLEPLKQTSLREEFVGRFEELILSGRLAMGQKLPSERELAWQLGVSRPVVHEGLLDLAAKGLVTLKPRVGTIINDYRTHGSISLLASLVHYHRGKLAPELLMSMLEMRELLEVETARRAALHRTPAHLEEFQDLLDQEARVERALTPRIVELDFTFHHRIALASGNLVYPLIITSFRQVYTNLTRQFFQEPDVVDVVFDFHRSIVMAIDRRDAAEATDLMHRMLDHGRQHLLTMIANQEGREP